MKNRNNAADMLAKCDRAATSLCGPVRNRQPTPPRGVSFVPFSICQHRKTIRQEVKDSEPTPLKLLS